MRILAIQDRFRTGGTEAQFLDLTERWRAEGRDVVRLVFRGGGGLAARARSSGCPLVRLQPCPSPWDWWAPGLLARIRSLRPDRVVCFGRNAHWSLGRAWRAAGYPGLAATVRTGRALPAGYGRLLRGAEAVVANSSFAARVARAAGAAPGRVRVVENGCRLAGREPASRPAARSAFGLGEDERVLLCLGSFVPGKAQERLLAAWEQMPGSARRVLRLWFVGDGPRRRAVARRARRLPAADRIRFWGSRDDVGAFLAAADAAVSVSREESSPNALVEALWSGLPVFALSCAGVDELVRPGLDGEVFPATEEGLGRMALTLAGLGTDPAAVDRWRASAGAGARPRFDPDARARDYLALFDAMSDFSPPS
jgi:alpha-1,6-mannosyltransferase